MDRQDKKHAKPHKVEGSPFGATTPRKKANMIRWVAEMAARKALLGEAVKPAHGYGDPNSQYPGDRPEAYDPDMTAEHFAERFTSTMDDLAAITFSDGTQIHGKLKAGFVPLNGWAVDEAGFVVKAPMAETFKPRSALGGTE